MLRIFILTLLFSLSNSLSSCETCLSLVSVSNLLESEFKTPLNVTKSFIELTCEKCPVMNSGACSDVLNNIETVYKACDHDLLNCEKSCYDLELCQKILY